MPENGLFSLVLKSIVFHNKNMRSLHCYYSEFIHIAYQWYEGMSYRTDAVRTYQWFLSGKWQLGITKCTKILIHISYLSQWRKSFIYKNRDSYMTALCSKNSILTFTYYVLGECFLQWNSSLRHGSPTCGPQGPCCLPGFVMWTTATFINCALNTKILQ